DARLVNDALEIVGDNRIVTLDVRTLRQLSSRDVQIPGIATGPIGSLSPDGRSLAVGLVSGAVDFVDLGTGRAQQGTGPTGSRVQGIAFAPTGRVALTTDENGHVTIWNPRKATVLETFTGH